MACWDASSLPQASILTTITLSRRIFANKRDKERISCRIHCFAASLFLASRAFLADSEMEHVSKRELSG